MTTTDTLTTEAAACRVDILRRDGAAGMIRVAHWSGPICTLYLDPEGVLHLVELEQPGEGAA